MSRATERRVRPHPPCVVAIDGPAGAGKSTLARLVAEHLGLKWLDTGAMYRAVAYGALVRGIDPADAAAVVKLAREIVLDPGKQLRVDGVDVAEAIRSPQVDAAVSIVAANPEVRAEMVARQQAWVEDHGGGVVEGRDIGTVVFPDAQLKIYLTASADERARRRALENSRHDLTAVARALALRDKLDSTRATSPLAAPQDVAADARVVDSTGREAAEVLEEVLAWL